MDSPPITLRSTLLGDGLSSTEVQLLRRSGELVDVRRGSYLATSSRMPERPEERHAVLIRAALPHLAPHWVLSHVSAAVVHGLPIWRLAVDHVHVSRGGSGGARVTRGVHRHVSPLPEDDVTVAGGLTVTSLARTVSDIARSAPFEQALVVADAALSTELITAADLRAQYERIAKQRGSPAVRRVIEFADAGAQSPGETLSRIALWRAGLPKPVLQYRVRNARGDLVATTDFGWEERRLVGEFDGRIKYDRLLLPGQLPGDVVFAEKEREDAIRAEDHGVVRWTWRDLSRFEPIAERIRRRLT